MRASTSIYGAGSSAMSATSWDTGHQVSKSKNNVYEIRTRRQFFDSERTCDPLAETARKVGVPSTVLCRAKASSVYDNTYAFKKRKPPPGPTGEVAGGAQAVHHVTKRLDGSLPENLNYQWDNFKRDGKSIYYDGDRIVYMKCAQRDGVLDALKEQQRKIVWARDHGQDTFALEMTRDDMLGSVNTCTAAAITAIREWKDAHIFTSKPFMFGGFNYILKIPTDLGYILDEDFELKARFAIRRFNRKSFCMSDSESADDPITAPAEREVYQEMERFCREEEGRYGTVVRDKKTGKFQKKPKWMDLADDRDRGHIHDRCVHDLMQ
jgi:hypothetical protein